MTGTAYTVSQIASICNGNVHPVGSGDRVIIDLLIDSRRLINPEQCLFVALVSERNDGNRFVGELYEKGVRSFLVSRIADAPHPQLTSLPAYQLSNLPAPPFSDATFILVPDTLLALQQIGAYHRSLFSIPVIGITGSNGKTIVKEWLFQLNSPDSKIIRSPKSYNSQIGVPLSVWKIKPEHELAIFEAGISLPGEMKNLEGVIRPTIGIFTNVGHAHDEHFENQRQKVAEKLKLFSHSEILIYCLDYPLITECLQADAVFKNLKTFTWSRNPGRGGDLQIIAVEKDKGKTWIGATFRSENIEITIPFTDEASIENAIHCLATELVLSGSAVGRQQWDAGQFSSGHGTRDTGQIFSGRGTRDTGQIFSGRGTRDTGPNKVDPESVNDPSSSVTRHSSLVTSDRSRVPRPVFLP